MIGRPIFNEDRSVFCEGPERSATKKRSPMRRMRRRSERYKNKLIFSYALGSLAKRTRISIHPEVLFLFNLSLGAYCIQKNLIIDHCAYFCNIWASVKLQKIWQASFFSQVCGLMIFIINLPCLALFVENLCIHFQNFVKI